KRRPEPEGWKSVERVRPHRGPSLQVLFESDEPAPLEPEGPEVRDEIPCVPLHGRANGRDPAGLEVSHEARAERLPDPLSSERRIDPDDLDPAHFLVLAEVPRP